MNTTKPFVKCVVNYSDIQFLIKSLSLSLVNSYNISFKTEIEYTINYLKETLVNNAGSDLVTIELNIETDVKALIKLINNKTIFKYLTSAEIRGYELWTLEELILELPLMYKQQQFSNKVSSFIQ